MKREQHNPRATGAALAALALLATLLALPAASHEAPAPRTAGDSSAAAAPADTARPSPVPSTGTSRVTSPAAADPFVAALVGVIPLASGYYLTSAPRKGIAFTLADAVLIGSIWNIRRDDNIPDRDVAPYFFLLGAVNLADAVLSGLQARGDAVRARVTLTPSGEPMVGLAWTF